MKILLAASDDAFRPTPGLEVGTYANSGVSTFGKARDFNFCVRCTPPWGYENETAFVTPACSVILSKNRPSSCNGAEWSKDKTQAAESIKWRPQQAYGSNQFLLVQPQTVFSTHTQNPHAHA